MNKCISIHRAKYQLLAILLAATCPLAGQAQTADAPDSAEPAGMDRMVTARYIGDGDLISPQDQSPDEVELTNTISRYADRVLELEVENGAYNNGLVEELIGLGLAYSAAGSHKEALNVFARALHVNRVNEGLHNINQIAILERVIQANTALSDYDSLSKNYGYLLWVYSRNYGSRDPRLVPVLNRIANWHLDSYSTTAPPDSVGHLIMAANLFSKSIEVIESVKGPEDPDLINALYGIVNANFKLVEPFGFVPDIDSFISGKITPLLPSNFDTEFEEEEELFYRNRYNALDYSQDHLSRIIQDRKNTFSLVQNSYKSGRNALQRIIDIHRKNPELPALSYAYALTHMGDWYLRFYKRSYAMANYEQAYEVLRGGGYDVDTLQSLFGYPRSLGTFKVPEELEADLPSAVASVDLTEEENAEAEQLQFSDIKDSRYVVVEFNVTKYGAVRNLEIIEANPADNVRFRRMARNTITATPFRPRLEDGKPTLTENVKMLYKFE